MKKLSFTFLFLLNCYINAQTLDPYKFFPSSVGNVWEYNQVWGFAREEIYKDSIDTYGYKHLFFKYNEYLTPTPRYKISFNVPNVFRIPFNPNNPHWLYFKLDADTGDVWIVNTIIDEDSIVFYQIGSCKSIIEGYFLDYYTTFKQFTFYDYQNDSTLNEYSWPRYTITLGYGLGEVMLFDEEGGGPQRTLQGCIIDGDTIGNITSVDGLQFKINSFELFQNYPNPFNSTTNIKFNISEPQNVKLSVYSLLGEEVAVLINEYKSSGTYTVNFNADELASGIYLYSLSAGTHFLTKKFILLK